MSNQVAHTIHEIVGREFSSNKLSLNIFVLQVLSWLKLSQNGVLSKEQKFENARFAEGPIHPSSLEYLFIDFANNKDLGKNAQGFEVKKNTIARMNHSVLTTLLDFLWSAYQSNNIDYEKAVWGIVNYSDPHSDSPFLPYEVAKLVSDIVGVQPNEKTYCPFDSSYNFAIPCSKNTNNIFTEANRFSPYPFLINILCDTNIQPHFSDPIEAPSWVEQGGLKQFDVTLAFPPFGMRYRKLPPDIFNRFPEISLYGEVLHIRHCIAQTKRKAVIAVPHGILFRTSAGERELKQSLVEKGQIETVISLPSALLRNTSIPFALIVLNLQSDAALSDEILFIDASSENFFKREGGRNVLCKTEEILTILNKRSEGPYSETAPAKTCADNDYNLLPNRYVLSPDQKKLEKLVKSSKNVALGKIADLIRPQSVRSKVEGTHEFLEVMVNDIPLTGYIPQPVRSVLVSNRLRSRAKQQRLEPLDILLSIKGTIGVVGIVPPVFEGEWLAGQSFQIIRLKDKQYLADPRILFMFLRSSVGNELIKSKAAGAAVQMVQIRDIRTLPVILLTEQEQEKVLNSFDEEIAIQKKINTLQTQLNSIKERHWGK